jgi:hypothetical protein
MAGPISCYGTNSSLLLIQVWQSLKKGVSPFENEEISGKARALLKESFLPMPGVSLESVASDGTTKLLVDLTDGLQVHA